jgi:hypothetical protein
MLRRCLGACIAALALLPAIARADTYTVFGCRAPSGAPAATSGWAAASLGAATTADTCAAGGTLSAGLAPDAPGGSVGRLRFEAPAGTRIVRLQARRRTTGASASGQTQDVTYELTADNTTLERCVLAVDSPCTADLLEPIDKQGLDAAAARFSVICSKGGDERCTKALRVEAEQLAVGLRDAAAPVVSGVQVTDDGERSGVLRVRFDAADAGGGVYRALVKVDGVVRAVAPLGTGACADAAPADDDPFQFLVPVPCPPLVTGVPIAIAAGDLSPGPHTIQVEVEDAAGNATSAYVTQFPRPNVAGGGSLSPEGAERLQRAKLTMRFVRSRSTRLRNRFGQRVVLRGRLVDGAGRSITGARIDVEHLVGPRGRVLAKTGLKTRARGELTLILPLDLDTRRIRFAYRALRPGPVTSAATVRLDVVDRAGEPVQLTR